MKLLNLQNVFETRFRNLVHLKAMDDEYLDNCNKIFKLIRGTIKRQDDWIPDYFHDYLS